MLKKEKEKEKITGISHLVAGGSCKDAEGQYCPKFILL
jgi:hypothetical protein